MAVQLYHMAPSFYSTLARLTLAEKGVSYEAISVNIGPMMENYQPWYMKMHPEGVVPLLAHDGQLITETTTIMRYIDDTFPGPPLSPQEPSARQALDEWLDRLAAFPTREYSYGLQSLALLKPLQNHSYTLRRSVLRKHAKQHPELASLYQARLDDIDQWQATSNDPEKWQGLQEQLEQLIEALKQSLADDREWLLGTQYTLADVWWTVLFSRLRQFKQEHLWQNGAAPKLEAYDKRLRARPSFQQADVWEGVHVGFMIKMLAPFLLPRLLGLSLVLGGGLWLLLWLFR